MKGFDYSRRPTVTVHAGRVAIGGDNPVRLQSMTNTSTMDTEGSVGQSARLAEAGSELLRLQPRESERPTISVSYRQNCVRWGSMCLL